jgi:hypothetical protein
MRHQDLVVSWKVRLATALMVSMVVAVTMAAAATIATHEVRDAIYQFLSDARQGFDSFLKELNTRRGKCTAFREPFSSATCDLVGVRRNEIDTCFKQVEEKYVLCLAVCQSSRVSYDVCKIACRKTGEDNTCMDLLTAE